MSPAAIADLRALAQIRGQSQGDVIESLVSRALRAALRLRRSSESRAAT
jgi:hypothetical protein